MSANVNDEADGWYFGQLTKAMEGGRDLPPIQRKLTVAALARREGRAVINLVQPGTKVIDPQALSDAVDLDAWGSLPLPAKTRFLGDVVLTASRLFLIGTTGLGKTQLGHGMACGIASGSGFLHWPCDRPAKVLVFDGEMSSRLVQERLSDAVRRHPTAIPKGNLVVIAHDQAAALAKQFPGLGTFGPFNKPAGQQFAKRVIELLKPEVVIFDNLMSLVIGDHASEEPWRDVTPLVMWLKERGVAQIWFDHTGWDSSRQYGSSTKQWSVDAVGNLSATAAKGDRDRLTFSLSFQGKGTKARERCKANWQDFADRTITMEGDAWSFERVSGAAVADAKVKRAEPRPVHLKWHEALQTVLRVSGRPTCTVEAWWTECVRIALAEDAGGAERRKDFRRAKSDLAAAGWIEVDGETVKDGRPDLDLGAL